MPPEPSSLEQVLTPALVVDWPCVERNVAAMARRATAARVDLRPHAKTHKSAEVARLQIAAGADGLTVATPHEAACFVAAGVSRITIARPVGDPGTARRVAELGRDADVRVVVDGEPALALLDDAARAAGTRIGVLWEVDCGAGRCGTEPGAATAARVRELTGRLRSVELDGVMTFGGHAYAATDDAGIRAVAQREADALRATAAALADAGVAGAVRSAGTTPTARHLTHADGVTELRPGNYVFNDTSQVALGVAGLEQCALTVLATVVSRPAADRAIVDAGCKALSVERPAALQTTLGAVAGHPRLAVRQLYEEHGVLVGDGASALRVGDRVRIVPSHACTTANLHAAAVVVDGDAVQGSLAIGARGWS